MDENRLSEQPVSPAATAVVEETAVPESKPVFPCIWQAILVMCGAFFLTLMFAVFAELTGMIAKTIVSQCHLDVSVAWVSPFLLGLGNLIGFSVPAIVILYFTRPSFASFFTFRTFRWSLVPVLMLALLGLSITFSEVDNISRYFLPMPDFIKHAMDAMFAAPKWVLFFVLVIVAGVSEELLFRGVILGGFLTHYSPRKSIYVSALLFSLMHLNPYQFISAFFCGIFLGWVYYRTGSIWLCMFCHGFHNFICWAALIMPFKIEGWNATHNETETSAFQPYWLDLTGLMLVVIGLSLLYLLVEKQKHSGSSADTRPIEDECYVPTVDI